MTWQKLIESIAKRLHQGKLKPEDLSPEMVKGYANRIYSGVMKGYTEASGKSTIADTDKAMLAAIKENVFIFSGFKTHAELSEWSSRLLSEDGKVKPFMEFFKEVRAINKTYSEHYLKAEYNHAIATSQSISKYQQFIAETDALPMWEMSVVMDDRTRHAAYDGIRLPFDNPFWRTHWPPLEWGCRCTTKQSNSSIEVPPKGKLPELKEMFKSNPGIDGVVFPDSHPMIKMVDDKSSRRIRQQAIFAMDRDEQFKTIKKFDNGGSVNIHLLVDQLKSDYKGRLIVANDMAIKGKRVDVLPDHIHQGEFDARNKLLAGYQLKAKVPDLAIDRKWYIEIEEPNIPLKKRAVRDRAKKGLLQCRNVTVILNEDFQQSELDKIITSVSKSFPDKSLNFRFPSGRYYPKGHEPE